MAVTSIPSIPKVSIDVSAPTLESCDLRGHVAKVSTQFNCDSDFSLDIKSTLEAEKVPTIKSPELKDNPEFVTALYKNLNLVFSECLLSLEGLLPTKEQTVMDVLESIPNSSSIETINMPVENMLRLIAQAINSIIKSEERAPAPDTDIIVAKSPKYPNSWQVTFQNSLKNYNIVKKMDYLSVNEVLDSKGWEIEKVDHKPDQRDNPNTISILIKAAADMP